MGSSDAHQHYHCKVVLETRKDTRTISLLSQESVREAIYQLRHVLPFPHWFGVWHHNPPQWARWHLIMGSAHHSFPRSVHEEIRQHSFAGDIPATLQEWEICLSQPSVWRILVSSLPKHWARKRSRRPSSSLRGKTPSTRHNCRVGRSLPAAVAHLYPLGRKSEFSYCKNIFVLCV